VVLLEEFAAHQVEVVFLQAPTDHSPEDALVLQVQGMLAEYERAKIVERCRRGRLHKARQGSVNALTAAPFGYRYVRKSETEPARYEIVPLEAERVRGIFEALVHQHTSLREIARMLTAEHVPTRRGAPRWDAATVHTMLRNPAYIGRAAYGRTETKERSPQLRPRHGHPAIPRRQSGVHRDKPPEQWISIPVPPIVSEELFAAANEQLERNRHQCRRGRRGYLLQGLVVCALCGYGFYGGTGGKKLKAGNRNTYYRCGGTDGRKFGGKRVCTNSPMRADALDDHVWGSVRQVLEDPQRVLAEWLQRGSSDGVQAELQTQRDEAATLLDRVEGSLKRLLDAYESGVLELEELNRRTEHLKERRQEARNRLQEAESRLAKSVSLLAVGGRLSDFAERVAGGLDRLDWEQRRQLIRTLVARVEIGDERVTIVYRLPPPSSSGGAEAGSPAASGRPPGSSRCCEGLLAPLMLPAT
jgi:site-specific DNA recombinase